jgi:hypothetical protein
MKMTASSDIALKMETVLNAETSVYLNESTRYYILEGCHLPSCRHENLKSHHIILCFISALLDSSLEGNSEVRGSKQLPNLFCSSL